MFIYQIYNKINRKSYIGQCIYDEFYHRYSFNEWWGDRSNKQVSKDCKKYGKENFIIKMLVEGVNDRCLLNRLEEYFCRKFNTYVPNGYNVDVCCANIGDINKLENYISQNSKPRELTFKENTIENLPGEIWKDVVGHIGLYKVSNLGRVKGLDRMEHRAKYSRRRKGQLMHQHIDNWGYLRTTLCKDGITWSHHVHKLVALAFVSNPNPKFFDQVNHKFGNKLDNRPEVLEWTDNSGNQKHAFDTGLKKSGEKHYRAKLTEKQVLEIRKLNKTGKYIHNEIAKMFNVSKEAISGIVTGRNWKRVL